jgi:hypothetical protein
VILIDFKHEVAAGYSGGAVREVLLVFAISLNTFAYVKVNQKFHSLRFRLKLRIEIPKCYLLLSIIISLRRLPDINSKAVIANHNSVSPSISACFDAFD